MLLLRNCFGGIWEKWAGGCEEERDLCVPKGGGGGLGGSERKKEKKWKEVFKSPILSSASCHFDSPIPGESGLLPERCISFFFLLLYKKRNN